MRVYAHGENIMPIMNDIKQGVDLGHPKPTLSYGLPAIIAVMVLISIFGIAAMFMGKLSKTVGKASPTVETAIQNLGAFGTGYN